MKSAFERALKTKKGEITSPNFPPARLIGICLKHLQERSDPILSPSFLSQCHLEEIFGMDAIAHEMQRHRMKIGNFYQFLVIELMRSGFDRVYDGKREGDVEAEINTPSYKPGLRLYISVKKSSDTVGGQDIGGVFNRLETLAKQDKNLTRPYMGVVAVATPQRGVISDYSASRFVRCKDDGSPYSANCEVWHPGFIFPFVCGRQAYDVYREALKQVGDFFPFNTLVHREKCSKMLAEELKKLGLVSLETGRIDPLRFQAFISRQSLSNAEKSNDDQ
ncbi:MAG: hypothetical protein HY747_04360 [Elusimicrobia bacterium]|nr:hypothetical protein [Elusimicrobiota bacterium]